MISLALAALLLLLGGGVVTYQYGKLKLQIAMADEQVEIFESMRLKAEASTPVEAAECMLYVQNYYPSGSKQVIGSRLDRVVELARASAMREIASHLRYKTKKDIRDDPAKWIESLKQATQD